jgi:hypothetical protein
MAPRKRLGQLLTELKVIDEHQLQSALGHQKQWGGKLGVILVQKGFCREDQMVSALSQHLGMPAVRLSEVKIDPLAVKTVSRAVAERLHVFAYEVTGSGRSEVITIAMSDPTDLSAVDQLAFHTGKRIKPMLAGDSEVINAIQKHYGAETPSKGVQPLPAGSRPFMEGAAAAPGAAMRPTPVAPISPVPAAMPTPVFSKRAEPPRPPPPVMQSANAPETAAAVAGGNGALAAEALAIGGEDLPADSPMEGLEPIAAHTQGEESVQGAEDVPDEGATSDEVAGLEMANPREAVEAVDVQAMTGLAPGLEPQAEQGAPDAGGAEALPLEDPAALQGWAEGESEGLPLETEDPAAAPPPAEGGWSVTAELPVDAIMGTADALETSSEGAAPATDAPDAWSDIADPLAGSSGDAGEATQEAAPGAETDPSQEQWSEGGAREEGTPEAAWAAAAAEVAAAAADLAAQESATAAEGDSFLQPPGDPDVPAEDVSIEAEGWSEEPVAATDQEQAGAGAGEAAYVMEEDAGSGDGEHGATQPQGWLSRRDADSEELPAEQGSGEEGAASEQGYAGDEQAYAEEAGAGYGEGGAAEEQAADEFAQQESADGDAPADTEGWIASPEDQQQAGWFGDALSSTMPLSPADLGTLAAIGLEPSDAAAAQRVLACLVRVLNRRQAIDLDELAAEIRESRVAGEAAAQAPVEEQPAGGELGGGESGEAAE